MGNYRTTQQPYNKNFGGINQSASVMSFKNNEAVDIVNFDIASSGTIKKRAGFSQTNVHTFSIGGASGTGYNLGAWVNRFQGSDLAKHFVLFTLGAQSGNGVSGTFYVNKIFAGASLASLSSITVPSAIPTSGLANVGNVIGVPWIFKGWVANRSFAPIGIDPVALSADSIENLSQINPPTNVSMALVSDTLATYGAAYFAVSSISGRGESTLSGLAYNAGAVTAGFNGTNYNVISWDLVDGALGYNLYVSIGGAWYFIATVSSSTSTYNQTAVPTATSNVPTVNTAYNTPASWNSTDGFPDGLTVVARGSDERMFAWRDDTVWASALRNPLDWFSPNDAFAFTVSGPGSNKITSIASLNDYVVIFTEDTAFIYSGAGPSTINLLKIIPVGCLSHKSVVYFGSDFFFWSQYGPSMFSRILSGQDIGIATNFSEKIRPYILNNTSLASWKNIVGYRDITRSNIVWSITPNNYSYNKEAIVYNYEVGGFTRYDNWGFTDVFVDQYTNTTYGFGGGLLSGTRFSAGDGEYLYIATLGGNTDAGEAISAEYESAWFDMDSWFPKKRIPFTDVIVNRSLGNYACNITWSFDYGRYTSSAVPLTQTTTNGSTITTTSSSTTEHRVYMDGLGNAFQIVFSSTDTQPCEIIAWRPNASFKGYR